MSKQLTRMEQTEILNYLGYIITMMECLALKKKYNFLRKHVIEGYNILNKIGYTKNRPSWEVKEDPRQLKLFN